MQRPQTGQPTCLVYPLKNYTFGNKDPKLEKDKSVAERLKRMRAKYDQEGPRRSVEAVLVVHQHNHPYAMLIQIGDSFFKLPGGRLRPGEDEVEGLKRKLANNLSSDGSSMAITWDVGECIGVFWRPNFETVLYPFLPAHITKPKEIKKLFLVPLPERCAFAVPKNLKLLAVPLFELYDNVARYGSVIASIPTMLSRFSLTLIDEVAAADANGTDAAHDEQLY